MYDTYNDMFGPFEVEQVTHIFSQETGFVTCIIPDLVVQCNEIASMAMTDALMSYFTRSWLGHQKDAFNSGGINSVELGDLPWTGGRAFTQTGREIGLYPDPASFSAHYFHVRKPVNTISPALTPWVFYQE